MDDRRIVGEGTSGIAIAVHEPYLALVEVERRTLLLLFRGVCVKNRQAGVPLWLGCACCKRAVAGVNVSDHDGRNTWSV